MKLCKQCGEPLSKALLNMKADWHLLCFPEKQWEEWIKMDGKLVPEVDLSLLPTGRKICVSCHLWNCWHPHGEPCDVTGCECVTGNDAENK